MTHDAIIDLRLHQKLKKFIEARSLFKYSIVIDSDLGDSKLNIIVSDFFARLFFHSSVSKQIY